MTTPGQSPAQDSISQQGAETADPAAVSGQAAGPARDPALPDTATGPAEDDPGGSESAQAAATALARAAAVALGQAAAVALGQAPTPGVGPTGADSQPDVGPSAAFNAGWEMAQLHGPILVPDAPDVPLAPLPAVSELSQPGRIELAIERLDKLMKGPLAEALNSARGPGITTVDVRQAADAEPFDADAFRKAVESLFVGLLIRLSVADRRLGSALSLGRSLSDTCWLPQSADDFAVKFGKYRLSNLHAWLTDLAPTLPALSAGAVSLGLDHWAAWLSVNSGTLKAEQYPTTVRDAVRVQGEHWRAILAGDTDAKSLLTPDAYVQAGEAALQRAGKIVRRVGANFWFPVLLIVLATGGATFLAVHYSMGTARVWGALVSLAAGFGITGKSIQATARQLATDAGRPLLALGEIDALGWATTWLPAVPTGSIRQRHQLRKLGVAPPRSRHPLVSGNLPGPAQRASG